MEKALGAQCSSVCDLLACDLPGPLLPRTVIGFRPRELCLLALRAPLATKQAIRLDDTLPGQLCCRVERLTALGQRLQPCHGPGRLMGGSKQDTQRRGLGQVRNRCLIDIHEPFLLYTFQRTRRGAEHCTGREPGIG